MGKMLQNIKNEIRWEICGLLLISAGIIGIFSVYTDAVGILGVLLSRYLKGFSGSAAIITPILIILWGIYCLYRRKNPEFTPRLLGLFIILLMLVWIIHIKLHMSMKGMNFIDRLNKSADLGIKGIGGGILGEMGLSVLFGIFGDTGSYILMGTFCAIGFILTTGSSISALINKIKSKLWVKNINIVTPVENDDKIKVVNMSGANIKNIRLNTTPSKSQEKIDESSIPSVPYDAPIIINNTDIKNLNYTLPPVSLLKKNSSRQNSFSEKELLNNAQVLEKTLESFGVQAKVVQVSCGPTITRFEIQPSPGVKVSRIVSLADDIALSLAAPDVRIEAPIPGKAAIGIEVPNKQVSSVLLRDVIETQEFKTSSKLTIALGKDIGGNPVVADLAEMPHLLIAGATGSGKSVCINTIISSILYKAFPNEVKFLMIDPKVVELTVYNDIPHLLTPVVTDAKKAAAALNWVVMEMEKRYQTFAKEGVRDITRYNELNTGNPLSKVLVIIDELADLMMVSPREVEDSICRLAQMARAAGIHLVVATQRPSVDIITGLIKANIPSRISFAVSSQVDSRTILDVSGAEKLLGKGDMLFFPVGASKPTRIQGAYVSEEEVEKLVDFVKKQKPPAYEKTLSDFKEVETEKKEEETDELFKEALRLVIDSGQASISMLQRRLHIGYSRAARLIDQMEERGFVGGFEGTKPREILISKEQFERYFNT
ncbi:MAG: segregation ATPase FtsK/SpoIIIE, family [Thermoanaerobacteraceae bacterium]|jgi:S-DNA-T family DNA segregation ATPase FtsK/SpoIIIE|nr:segregation ATPase FtsK/SpoIIIE, family [Thermoanaerobacteraceae bacterium]MDN5302829.1 segregation ATPase FtsK/SpoIIIE, family [Thermoanaerobacteraceae bacterium]RKL62042.1 DNA translocase FtsK [Thermoanaerobacteraceae bacterium SP2]